MEIELKYAVDSIETASKIIKDEMLCKIEEPNSREIISMKAIYYDTEDFDLLDNEIAFRVRVEGCKKVATLKRGGKVEGAVHERAELNAPVSSNDFLDNPDLGVFNNAPEVADVMDKIAGKSLKPLMEMNFERKRFKIDYQNCIMEVSADFGHINANGKQKLIRELELELFSGDREKLIEMGEILKEKYNLEEKSESKFLGGLILLGKAEQ